MAQYVVRVKGVLDDKQILSQLRAIEKKGITLGTKGGTGTRGTKSDFVGGADTTKQTKGMKTYTRSVQSATTANQRFGSSTMNIAKKVAQFGAVTAVIRGVTSGIGSMVTNVYELDKALTEFIY